VAITKQRQKSTLTCGRVADEEGLVEAEEEEAVARGVDHDRAVDVVGDVGRGVVVGEGAGRPLDEPRDHPALVGAEVDGLEAVDVRGDEGVHREEGLGWLPGVVVEDDGVVSGEATPGLADGAAAEEVPGRQADEDLPDHLLREAAGGTALDLIRRHGMGAAKVGRDGEPLEMPAP